MALDIKLYGTERCHKTQYYKTFLNQIEVDFSFLDVENNDNYAEELRSLYQNRKLKFPTIKIGDKKLRFYGLDTSEDNSIELEEFTKKIDFVYATFRLKEVEKQ